jgi:MFS family permease
MPGKLRRLGHSIGLNRTVVALSIARLADGIGNSTLFVIIPLYVYSLPDKSFDLPLPLLVGILISAYGFAVGLLQPFTGALADRLGCYKLTISVGLVVLVVAMMLYAFADRYIDLLGLRVLQGAGLALEIPSTMALMALVTQRATRGGAMGFYTTARMAGLASGPLLGGFMHVLHLGLLLGRSRPVPRAGYRAVRRERGAGYQSNPGTGTVGCVRPLSAKPGYCQCSHRNFCTGRELHAHDDPGE